MNYQQAAELLPDYERLIGETITENEIEYIVDDVIIAPYDDGEMNRIFITRYKENQEGALMSFIQENNLEVSLLVRNITTREETNLIAKAEYLED